jgi:hypothetical protein
MSVPSGTIETRLIMNATSQRKQLSIVPYGTASAFFDFPALRTGLLSGRPLQDGFCQPST